MDKGDAESNTTSPRTEHISKKSKQDSDNQTQCTAGGEELSHMPGRPSSNQNKPEDNDDVGGGGGDSDSDDADNQSEMPLYEKHKHECRPVDHYLEQPDSVDYFDAFMIPEKFLKRFWVMDIVNPHSRNSCCFTKRYVCMYDGKG